MSGVVYHDARGYQVISDIHGSQLLVRLVILDLLYNNNFTRSGSGLMQLTRAVNR